jgi:D-tyrosyl-tRNA(Tyr) deacylase
MIAVIQRVSAASVSIQDTIKASISTGLLLLLGVEETDNREDLEWLASKVVNLRIFNDADGIMNVSVKDSHGDIIIVSQFTLHASTRKGNRPSYIKAAKADIAIPLYNAFINAVETCLGKPVQTGEFGADMTVSLLNDGPVTIIIDTKNRV